MLELLFLKALQHHVLLQREIQDQPVLVPVLWYVAHALAARRDAAVRNVPPAERDLAGLYLLQPRQPVHQLRLAVAVYARDADYLALAHLKAHALHGVLVVYPRPDVQVLDLQHRVLRLCLVLLYLQLDGTAHHHVRELLLVRVAGVHRADTLALAQYRDAVRDLHYLVELVRDEQDALALFGKAAHRVHELLYLLRRQHCRWLVEDQYLIVPVQHLEYLDALLHADCDVLHLRVEVHLEAVLLRERLNLFARLPLLQEAELRSLRAEDDVVQHREDLDELEVLVHHAYAQSRRVVRVVDLHGLAVLLDDALLRLVHAEEDAHQRALAGAVLAQKRVYLAAPELKRDIVVGHDAREPLCDAEHFYYVFRLRCHRPAPFLTYFTLL